MGSALRGNPSQPSGQELNGLLLVDKPSGLTSHDLVARVRRVAGTKACGHAGTLDPMATGLLLVLVGPATKLSAYLAESEKSYLGEIRLGLVTDTLDATGRTISAWPGPFPVRERVASALKQMEGPSEQVPPLFSAIKVNGQAAYKAARAGKELDLKPRPVTAFRLSLEAYEPPLATVTAMVSKGYYVRSMARDLGLALGLGGGSL
ncbi:MAG: tRNA pseudouridine(55) synthase TruB, partial [Deltaproteobacteria bacterium]|nr:tRNA pseudouridine(55) synthase TruB [Deltaproteobacteria bacterium]